VDVVCWLRGINVGKSVRLSMADLRAIAESCGYSNPRTHLQSGNLVITTDDDPPRVASDLEAAIAAATPIAPAVITRTADELRTVIDANPFTDRTDDPTRLHVTLGRDPIAEPDLDPADFAPEEWAVHGRELYLHLPNGLGRSTLAVAFDKQHRKAVVTTRNWRTVLAVADLLDPSR
jgi:uncharacterized protein (DUF1697 family)